MAYATIEDYELMFVDDEHEYLDIMLEEASDTIDRVTFNRIRGRGFDNLTDYQKEMVTKAVCYQARFASTYSEYLNMPVSGYTAGSISLQFDKSNYFNGEAMDTKAIQLISNSGLSTRRL